MQFVYNPKVRHIYSYSQFQVVMVISVDVWTLLINHLPATNYTKNNFYYVHGACLDGDF